MHKNSKNNLQKLAKIVKNFAKKNLQKIKKELAKIKKISHNCMKIRKKIQFQKFKSK